jgi:hypothetical protein
MHPQFTIGKMSECIHNLQMEKIGECIHNLQMEKIGECIHNLQQNWVKFLGEGIHHALPLFQL